MPKFLAVIKGWIVGHKLISIGIGVGAAAVLATSIAVPVSVANHKFTIAWKNEDGTVLVETKVKRGDMPEYPDQAPTKAETAQYSYTFAGWEPEIVEAKANADYKAKFTSTVKSYEVKFLDEDGTTELKKETLQYGATPVAPADPEKADTAEWDYSFNGWDKEIASVEGNQTYTATYSATKQKYLVRFLDEDETTVLKSEYLDYGATPVAPADPEKADTAEWDYSFDGWDKEISEVHAAQTYIATYTQTLNKYKVTWKNYDGTVLETDENVEYGTLPSYDGATPTKDATAKYTYSFEDWDKEITAVTGDQEYVATYNSTINKYNIKFLDYDGTQLSSEDVDYDELPVAPASPTRDATSSEAFDFVGWGEDIVTVSGNKVYTAQYASTRLTFSEVGDYLEVTGLIDSTYNGTIEIPSTWHGKPVKVIANNAFKDKNITGVTFNEGLETIGAKAFSGTRIISISLPTSLKEIQSYAFQRCSSLSSVTFAEGLETMGDRAFEYCGLGRVTLPGSLVTVGDNAFAYNLQLVVLEMNASDFTSYSSYMYQRSYSLTELYLPNYEGSGWPSFVSTLDYFVTKIKKSNISDSRGSFETSNPVDATNQLGKIYYLIGNDKYFVAPFGSFETVNNLTVNNCNIIKRFACCGNGVSDIRKIDSVTIGADVRTICECSFYSCPASTLTFEEGTESLNMKSGEYSFFRGMQNITEVDLRPRGITALGNYSFAGCTNLALIILPNTVKQINSRSFESDSALEEFTIPRDCNYIGSSVFYECTSIEEFKVHESNTSYKAVNGCLFSFDLKKLYLYPNANGLTSYTVPEGTEQIGGLGMVFMCDSTLQTVNLPSTLTYLGEWTFFRNDTITKVTYNGSVSDFEAVQKHSSWYSYISGYTRNFDVVECIGGNWNL